MRLSKEFTNLKPESVIAVSGKVLKRSDETINKDLDTGEVEVHAAELTIHNISETPPFPMDETADKVNEDLRLTHRYLDLRRPSNLNVLRLRHRAAQSARSYFDENGFLEVETPMLFKSTPEGAREFLVPSRLNAGDFYALLSLTTIQADADGCRCRTLLSARKVLRDEDLRADRQPEFTQIDIEVSFVDREGMYSLMEGLMKRIWKDVLDIDIPTPSPVCPSIMP